MAEQGQPEAPRGRQNSSPQVNNGQDVLCTVCNGLLRVVCHPTFHFPFNINLRDWRQASKKTRQRHVRSFLTMVNVLYQEAGGFVLIHTDRLYLSFFDEQVDKRLMAMVPDGSMFDERFRRVVVDERHAMCQVLPPSILPALGRPRFCVRDFHTTISLNTGRATPTYPQMTHLLTRRHPALPPPPVPSPFLHQQHQLVMNQAANFITENLSLQAKLATDTDLGQAQGRGRGEKLLNLCWERLDLPDFIAAFSKQLQGGCYCVGLEEEKTVHGRKWQALEGAEGVYQHLRMGKKLWTDQDHPDVLHVAEDKDVPPYEDRTGRYLLRGVRLSPDDQRGFRDRLRGRLQSDMFCFQTQTVAHQHRRLLPQVDCFFHPVLEPEEDQGGAVGGGRGGGRGGGAGGGAGGVGGGADESVGGVKALVHADLYVVEIRVGYYPGVCFQDSGGPEAYRYRHRRKPAVSGPVRVSGAECCRNLRV